MWCKGRNREELRELKRSQVSKYTSEWSSSNDKSQIHSMSKI